MTKRTIWVARFEHRHDCDVVLFDTEQGALKWRDELGEAWWEHEFPDEPKPTKNIGERYFEAMEYHEENEYFILTEHEVLP